MGERSLIEDIEVIIEELADAYGEAEDAGRPYMTLSSARGARFEGRVRRVQAALSYGLVAALQAQGEKT